MLIYAKPDQGVPMPKTNKTGDFMPTLEAAAETAKMLAEAGLDFEANEDDLDEASRIVRQAARDPTRLQTAAAARDLYAQTPASLLLVRELLQEYGHKVVQEAEHLRDMITNRLVIESDNPDARVRLRALEMLGKINDVGLFSDKREVTVTHQTTDDVKDRLRARLARLLPQDPEAVEDAEVIEEAIADAARDTAPASEPAPAPATVLDAPFDDEDAGDYDYELSLDAPTGPVPDGLFDDPTE